MTTPPLGAHAGPDGTTFAVYSSVAEQMWLCLFDADGAEQRIEMRPGGGDEGATWTAHVAGTGHGTRYGFRVGGPAPCDPAKLLLDPYARAIDGGVRWDDAVLGGDDRDSAPFVPRSVVHDKPFDWGAVSAPETPLAESIIYELHVKGFTMQHPDVPPHLRGTYAGVAHPAAIDHLQRLGITAVELLPVQHFVHDRALMARGLRNYWGYQPIGHFAPHDEYAAQRGAQVTEFQAMVHALHAAGIEVLLDVVFNHTAEAGADGPTLSLRGLDDAAYYRLDDQGGYVDDTGCGNTLDAHRGPGLRLVMDALRHWRGELGVDGFRFDLAAALGRGDDGFDHHSAFLEAATQDPVLDGAKLIAEPWDTRGYALGAFPTGWSEWNGRYRDTVRDFWRGVDGTLPDLATRLAGSSDLFGHGGRRPTASVNLICVHDGFTLADLVSYDHKHNDANGEGNRDGSDDNRSWNGGAEGPTSDPAILALRRRQRRNLLATLLLSQGVPLLRGGDELAHTQQGNNNAYCQDNAISWLPWPGEEDLTELVARVILLRRQSPAFAHRQVLRPDADAARDDLAWFRPDGAPMAPGDWGDPQARAITAALGDDALLMINGWWEPLDFVLPVSAVGTGATWSVVLDTAHDGEPAPTPAEAVTVARITAGRSLALLIR
jgi:isoamylase